MEPIKYKGYSIQEDYRNPYSNKPEFMYYPTKEGAQHDADYDGETFLYSGNCAWEDSIEDAKNAIDDLLDEDYDPDYADRMQDEYNERNSYGIRQGEMIERFRNEY